jgi:hypothetical protein
MGIYHQATTVIGYEISTKKFSVQFSEPNCLHNPPVGVKHCPECGHIVGTHKSSRMLDEWWEFTDGLLNNLPDGYTSDTLYDNGGNRMWIGYGATVADRERAVMSPIKSIEQIKADIALMLEPYICKGLIELNSKKFGVWTIYTGH